jgi:hypothetical protein
MTEIQILNTHSGICHMISTEVPESEYDKQTTVNKLNELMITKSELTKFDFPKRFFQAYSFKK